MAGLQTGPQRRGSDAELLRLLGVQMVGWVLAGASLTVRSRVGAERWGLGWKALLAVGLVVVLTAFVAGFRVRLRQIKARNRRG